MALTQRDYPSDVVEAARSVLLELVRLLAAYRDDIVVVGGWVPELLLGGAEPRHVGSGDVDVALNHRKLQDVGYETIQQLLRSRGYVQDQTQPFIYWRTVTVGGKELKVQVDFLAGEYEGTGPSHRTQVTQNMRPRKARGCDLAFEDTAEVVIEGRLPDGGKDSASVRIAGIVPFLVMKGMALAERLKEKDAYDVYYCLCNFPGGLEAVGEAIRPHMAHSLVREGLTKIGEKFASPDHVGPVHVADFHVLSESQDREAIQRDAYERVHYLLEKLGVT